MAAFRRLVQDRGGHFAIMGAILTVPLMLGAGLAVDLANISRYRAELQHATDSAALAIAREGTDVTDARATQLAELFMNVNLDPDYTDLVVQREGTSVSVRARTAAPMAFGGLFGYERFPVSAAASADTAYASYEIALVLDTTASMRGGKLSAMKEAVNGMVETMSTQVKDKDKLRFAVVPFSSFVNVGPQHGPAFDKDGRQIPGTGAEWLDLEGESPVRQVELGTGVSRFQLFANLGRAWEGCVETRVPGAKGYDTGTAEADPWVPDSLYVPAFAIDEPDTGGYANSYIASPVDPLDASAAAARQKWAKYGVATDGSGKPLTAGFSRVAVDGGPSGYLDYDRGPNFGCVTQPLLPLTNDYNGVRAKVGSLEARGTTNIMEGVAWGARVLTPGEPFAQAQDGKKIGVEKIMIVLTDGANVMGNSNTALRSIYSSYGFLFDGRLGIASGSAAATNAAMNERTLAACTHARQAGMTVYTIRLEEPDVKTGTMLQECASSAGHYFDAPSRHQLDDVFQTIRDRIVRVRIAS